MRNLFLASLFAMVAASGPAQGATLADLQWDYRVIAIFTATDSEAGEMVDELEFQDGLAVRDIAWFVISRENVQSNLETPMDLDSLLALRSEAGFEALLIGKDGQVKMRQDARLDLSEMLDAIDSMPMRQREMRENGERDDDV